MVVDALLCVVLPVWWRTHSMPVSGLPTLAIVLIGADALGVLPSSMDTYAWPSLSRLCGLLVGMDALQTTMHILTHRGWLGGVVREHHLVHHRHQKINPASAFDTGWLDALVQLICPLLVTLAAIQPDRTTAIAFGVIYSLWLVHIHTPGEASRCVRLPGLVTPEYHQAHHAGGGHYAHIFAVC
tara:strand:- start:6965 stop:7516 length:552 start_codon:yes stop_codon:yes gene_type:complete